VKFLQERFDDIKNEVLQVVKEVLSSENLSSKLNAGLINDHLYSKKGGSLLA